MRIGTMMLLALLVVVGGCKKEPEHPPTQKDFEQVIAETAAAYKDAPSQVEKEEAVGRRMAFLEKAVTQQPAFEEWICKLDQVRELPMTPLPRKLYIVKVRCGGMVLQNVMQGRRHGATPPEGVIEENDPVYMGVRLLNIRNRVRVSGTFIKDEEHGGILEESFNESISMELPHFGVVFDSIRSAHK